MHRSTGSDRQLRRESRPGLLGRAVTFSQHVTQIIPQQFVGLMRRLKSKKERSVPLYLTAADQEGLREAGRFNASVLDLLRPLVQPGVSTFELNRVATEYIYSHGNVPACIGYMGYQHALCTSLNNVVCHGIPSKTDVLKEGDIVNIDCTSAVDGYHGDSSETFLVGEVDAAAKELVQLTHDALWIGINAARPGESVIEIGIAIGKFAREHKLGVVESYQGHGVGRAIHQGPDVPHFRHPPSRRQKLMPGTCFTIEPMLNLGGKETDPPLADGWTVLTRDRSLSAQFEHTLLMTDDGPQPLTLTKNGPQEGHQF